MSYRSGFDDSGNKKASKKTSKKILQRKEYKASGIKFFIFAGVSLVIYVFILYKSLVYANLLPDKDSVRAIIFAFISFSGVLLIFFLVFIYISNIKKKIIISPDEIECISGTDSRKAFWDEITVAVSEGVISEVYGVATIYLQESSFYIDTLFFDKYSTIVRLITIAHETKTLKPNYNEGFEI